MPLDTHTQASIAGRAIDPARPTQAFAGFAPDVRVEFGLTRSRTPLRDDRKSGDEEQLLFTYAPGSRISQFDVEVTGSAFEGKLEFLKGAKVMPSPVIYNADGLAQAPSDNERAFIVDFTGIRSLLKLQLANDQGFITLVLSWMGTDFASKALYPVTVSDEKGQFLPKADVTGMDTVNLSGVETSKLLVQVDSTTLNDTNFSHLCSISMGTYPTNVKASLNGRLPFWSHPGALSEKVKLTGLVEDLNVLLKDATSVVPVKLLLTTDTPGVLKVNPDSPTNLNMSQSANARWGGQESVEVSLRAAEDEPFSVSFPTATSKAWQVSRLELSLSGRFPSWRAYSGQSNDHPGQLGMKVCARFSIARRCDFSQDGELFGFSLLLRPSTDGAEIMLEVAAGKDGQPIPGKSLAAANATLEANAAIEPQWIDVLFAAPIKVEARQEIWLTLKAKKGSVEWCGLAAPANLNTTTLYSDEGGAWRRYPSVDGENFPVAQVRILRRPFINENDPLLRISWGTLAEVSIDLAEETKSIELSQPPGQSEQLQPVNGTILVPLGFRAGASGSLTIQGATAFYKEKSAP